MDSVFALPYKRAPRRTATRIPAYEMIRFSINIMLAGCVPSAPLPSTRALFRAVLKIRSSTDRSHSRYRDGFTGVISDLGGPTANMYMLRCKSPRAEQTCRRLSCVYPSICEHMDTNHEPTIKPLSPRALI